MFDFCFHTDQSQNFSDSFLALLLRLPSCSFQHEVQVIVDRSVGQQPEVLKDDSKVASKVRYLTALYLFEIVIKYSRIAIGNRQFGIYGLEERALAGSHLSDQIDEFTQKLNKLIGKGKGEVIMNKVVNSKIGITKRLQDAAKTMFDGNAENEEFSLIGTQLDAYNSILGSILKTDKDNEKTVVVVKGGPGTGKSVIAMRLISGLAKTGKYNNIFYSTRSTSLIKGYTDILKNISYANGNDCHAIDLLKKNVKIKPHYSDDCKGESWIDALVVDEAHRIEGSSNDQNDTNKRNQTHLSQIMNMLFSSRVCVFFIDDLQSVKGTEIGTSENIKKAALGYYDNIIAENEAYLHGHKGAYHGGIPKIIKDVEKAKKNYQEALASGNDRKIWGKNFAVLKGNWSMPRNG